MIKFEQIKQQNINLLESKIEKLNTELSKAKELSIDEYIEQHIQKNVYGTYEYAFDKKPYVYIKMETKEALVEMVKLYLSQEVGE